MENLDTNSVRTNAKYDGNLAAGDDLSTFPDPHVGSGPTALCPYFDSAANDLRAIPQVNAPNLPDRITVSDSGLSMVSGGKKKLRKATPFVETQC